MDIALVVLLGLGDDLDLDVLEGEHADDLSPAAHTPAEKVLRQIERSCHCTTRYLYYHQTHFIT